MICDAHCDTLHMCPWKPSRVTCLMCRVSQSASLGRSAVIAQQIWEWKRVVLRRKWDFRTSTHRCHHSAVINRYSYARYSYHFQPTMNY